MKQASFGFFGKISREFGGDLIVGKRKTARPISTKTPMHLIFKSTGSKFFCDRKIEEIILDHARKYQITVYDITSNWSHIHLTIYLKKKRESYYKFIRTVTAAIVRYLSMKTGKDLTGLFDLRPYTKILSWGRQMKNMENYHEINEMESFGIFTRKKKAKTKANKNNKRP